MRAVALLALIHVAWQRALFLGFGLAGPKSGALGDDSTWRTSHWYLGQILSKLPKSRGEGSRWSMPPRGGVRFHDDLPPIAPKQNGLGHVGPSGAACPMQAVKKTFRRARFRARRDGWTFYRGQMLSLPQLGRCAAPAYATPKPHMMMPKKKTKRASVLTWNAGGLTSEIYNDLVAWLHTQGTDIALIQGTRWSGERTWRTCGFSVIQSGEDAGGPHMHSGLMVFVSERICSFEDLSYAPIIPGRLLHVKCKIGHNSLDLVNLYQYPDTWCKTRPRPLEARGELWTHLDQLLHRLAKRNITILAGDFNCPVMLPGVPNPSAPADAHDLSELLKKYHLGSVRCHDASPTYIGAQGTSSIDHIFMPKAQMDGLCRLGRSLPDFPVACWRAIRDHVPVTSSVNLGWRCWFHRPPCGPVLSKSAKATLHNLRHQQPLAWNDLQANLTAQITSTPASLSALPQLNENVLQSCHMFLRPHLVPPSQPAPQHRSLLAQLWHSYRHVRNTPNAQVSSLFQAWRHATRVQSLKKRLTLSCKRAKVDRLQKAVDEAHQASIRHDTRTVFAVIRRLTPKQPFRAIRLRGPQGEALPAAEECRQFETHFTSVFCSTDEAQPMPESLLQHMPFDQDELEQAFERAPLTKAVGPKAIPNVLLRMLAKPLACWLWPMLQQTWCNSAEVTIPPSWKDAWLVLLAKRLVRTPQDVRPIALTDSIGRTILGILTSRLRTMLTPTFQTLPIFAYVPARGTLEALFYVCQHCRDVRSLCESASPSYWRRQQQAPPTLCGGIILSLDMSQAFDRLPRSHLRRGFDMLHVPEHLSQFFIRWLDEATYHFEHRRMPCSVPTSQGVRQGCKASPMEWTIFLVVLLRHLNAALDSSTTADWVKKHLITYADDLLARWVVHSKSDVDHALQQIGIILDVLAMLGMKVNFKKSVLLLRFSGKQHKSVKKKLLVKCAGQTGILIPRRHAEHTFLPVVDHHVYLGVKLSFHHFEDLTLKYRLHIGRIAFLRLRPWLYQRHSYPLILRIQLWQTCVRTAYLHGLQATGITQSGLRRLHRHFVADLRKISRSPCYVTRESTVDLYHRLQLPLPIEHLQELWTSQYDRLCHRWQGLSPGDFLASFDLHSHFRRLFGVFTMMDAPNFVDILLCPYCDFSSQNQSQLTRHIRTTHKVIKKQYLFEPLRDAVAGRPQCSHCQAQLANRGGLQRHIVDNHCMYFDEHKPLQACLADDSQLRAIAASQDWQRLWQDADLLGQLRQYCSLCGLHFDSRKGMVEHLQKKHGDAWNLAQPFVAPLAAQTSTNPCVACGHEGKRAHACPVIRQLALIQALQHEDLPSKDLVNKPSHSGAMMTSPHKRARQTDQPGKDTKVIFQPARDAADGEPQCAHCGTVTKTMYILRRHIEDNYCHNFNPGRSVGGHVPSTWPWLLDQAHSNPIELLSSSSTTATLSCYCVLCGQHLQRSGALLPHINHDHDAVLTAALASNPHLLQELSQHGKCHCQHGVTVTDHRCPVHHQILLLHHLGRQAVPDPAPTAETFQQLWEDPVIRTQLTQQCGLCNQQCDIFDLGAHLMSHTALYSQVEPWLTLAQSPSMDCCIVCLQAAEVPEFCPVALNACAYHLRHGNDGQLLRQRRGPDGGSGRHFGQLLPQQEKKGSGDKPSPKLIGKPSHSGSATASSASRIPTTGISHGGSIHSFFTRRSQGSTSSPPESIHGLEGSTAEGPDDSCLTTPFEPASGARTSQPLREGDESQASGRDLATSTANSDDQSERRVALHAVQCAAEEDDPVRAPTDCHGKDASMDPGVGGTMSEPHSDPTLQVFEAPEHTPPVSPLGCSR